LADVVVGAELQADHAVDLGRARGEEDHRQRRLRRLQATEQLQAVDVGQADVDDRQCKGCRGGRRQRRLAAAHPVRCEAVGGQRVDDRVGDRRFVLDDEDRRAHHGTRRPLTAAS